MPQHYHRLLVLALVAVAGACCCAHWCLAYRTSLQGLWPSASCLCIHRWGCMVTGGITCWVLMRMSTQFQVEQGLDPVS